MAATKFRLYADAVRLLGDARFATIVDDVEARYELDNAYDEAVGFVLRQAAWFYALKATVMSASGVAAPGYIYAYTLPADTHLVHAIYKLDGDGRPCPFDLRQHGAIVSTNVIGPVARYVSTDFLDVDGHPPPEHVAQLIAAYLAFLVAARITGEAAATGRMSQLFASLLPEAKRIDALDEDMWLHHQRSGRFYRVARTMVDEAYWRFALVTVPITTVSGGAGGFTRQAAIPADSSRTRQLYVRAPDGRRMPFDIRERGKLWLTDATAFYAEYISLATAMDSTLWPDHYERAMLRQLQFDEAASAGGGQQEQIDGTAWKDALAATTDSEADKDDPWLQPQLDGSFSRAVWATLNAGFWAFSLKTSPAVVSGTPISGWTYSFALPGDWVRTQALYVAKNGVEFPFDVRQEGTFWYTNIAAFTARYVSSTLAVDATRWPQDFLKAVEALLDAENAAAGQARGEAMTEYLAIRNVSLAAHGINDNDWLGYQIDGRFGRASYAVINRGFWRWALKETPYTAETDQIDNPADSEFPYSFTRPSDWFKTHAVGVPLDGQSHPINIRETGTVWSTDAPNFVVRYLSTSALDATTWPEPVAKAVLAWLDWHAAPSEKAAPLAAEYEKLLADAMTSYARPEDDWLRFQLSGQFEAARKNLLEKGRWRHATKTVVLSAITDPLPGQEATGTVSDGYTSRFILPNDWMRTLDVYFAFSSGLEGMRDELDFREEQGSLHANRSPISLRYVSRLGLESTRWTAAFRDAVLSWLKYTEALEDPRMTAQAAAALQIFKDRCREAERLDDARDRPHQQRFGKLVQSRYSRMFGPSTGGGGGDNSSIATGPTVLTSDDDAPLTAS